MNLPCFTEEAYNELRNFLPENEGKYYSDKPWLDEFFRTVNISDPCRQSSIVVPDVTLASGAREDREKNAEDLLNVKMLYGAWKDKLTPAQATNPRLWTALCHETFHEYVMRRWQDDNGKVNIDRHYFATSSHASLCADNAISKLWWLGYMSYDETRESTNPWHMTETLLSSQKVLTDLIHQSFSTNKQVCFGLLSALKRIQEETESAASGLFRSCCYSYLNCYAAVTVIDMLEADEIEELAYTYMKSQL